MDKSQNQEEWDKTEKEFLEYLKNNYFNEIRKDILLLREKDASSIKSQLCLAFILADAFSRIHRIFQGVRGEDLDRENEKRFREWIDRFVLTGENMEYEKHRDSMDYDSKTLWGLRNSFLHFYSFPPTEKTSGYLVIGSGLQKEFNEKISEKLKDKDHPVNYIDGYYLIEAIFQGFLVQLQFLAKIINNDPDNYVKHVSYAHEILGSQSGQPVPFDDFEKYYKGREN